MELKTVLILTAVLLIYLCIGAAIFQATEHEYEANTRMRIMNVYETFLSKYNCVDTEALRAMLEAVNQNDQGKGRTIRVYPTNHSVMLWDFAGAFTFAITIVTTIGYGHVYPATDLGRALCVLYALIGIPLTLIVLGGIGVQLNTLATKVTTKLHCCTTNVTAHKAVSSLIVFLSGLVLLFVIPSVVFWTVEGWSLFEGLYFCFITLSTIGFGDYIAGQFSEIENETLHSLYRVGVYLWILVGLAYLSLAFKFISKTFINKAGQVKREAKKRVGSQRLSITEKRRNRLSREYTQNVTDTVAALGEISEHTCEMSLHEDVSLEQNNEVHLVKISTVQLKF